MYSKMSGRGGLLGREAEGLDALVRDHHAFAVLDVADEAGADDVEGAGLGGEDVAAVELAQHQRADAQRVAGADQLLVGQRHQGIGALDLLDRLHEAVDDPVLAAAGDQVDDHLGIGRRLADGAVADEVAAKGQAVGQVAVMGDREAAAVEFGEERLHVAQNRLAGGRVAGMADGGEAVEALDGRPVGEVVADEAELALRVEDRSVEGDDARRLLAAVLQGVEARAP